MTAPYYVLTSGAVTTLPASLVEDVARLLGQDADHVARVLMAARAWELREAAREAEHAKRREDPMRLADMMCCVERTAKHRRSALEDVK